MPTELPFIDEHTADAAGVAPTAVWDALLATLRGMGGAPAAAYGRVVGCDPGTTTPGFAGRPGETIVGFRVTGSAPPHRLELTGAHRFSRYRLTFLLGDDDVLRARSQAVFPGPHGRVYRALVLGTGAHRVLTGRMVRNVVRAAR